MHKNTVGVVIRYQDRVFYGKHGEGPYKGKWGFASVDASIEPRPNLTASRLAETSTLGLIEKVEAKKTRTLLGLTFYEYTITNENFPKQIQGVCKFLRSCFPVHNVPVGMSPWTDCKWSTEILKDVDPYTKDMQQYLYK